MTDEAFVLLTASRRHRIGRTDHIIHAGLVEAGQHFVALGVPRGRITLRTGACHGGDTIARMIWAVRWQLPYEEYPADWDGPCQPDWPDPRLRCKPGHRLPHRDRPGTYCPLAGPRRNQLMVDLVPKAGLCLSLPLPGSGGTLDCARRAKKASIEVWRRWDPNVPHPTLRREELLHDRP
jgi:hypothetical protein